MELKQSFLMKISKSVVLLLFFRRERFGASLQRLVPLSTLMAKERTTNQIRTATTQTTKTT